MKPDQLIKRRGKLGLIKVNADYKTVQEWITQRMNKDQQVCYQKLLISIKVNDKKKYSLKSAVKMHS